MAETEELSTCIWCGDFFVPEYDGACFCDSCSNSV